jgi:DNA repair exonuclease SbcCD ATPase subunit
MPSEISNTWHEEALIERVKEEIEKLRNNKENLDKMFSEYMQSFFSAEEVNEKIQELQQQLDDLKAEVSANLKLFSKNIIDEDQYKQQNDELQNSKKNIESELNKLKKIDEARNQAKRKYNNYVDFLNNVDMDNLDNVLLKKVINKIEAYTIIDEQGNEIKDIYIVWNMLDKSYDDMFYFKAKE